MYGRFLGEAAGITGEPRLAEHGKHLEAIGDKFEVVATNFADPADADHPARFLEAAAEPMHAIADHEQELWEQLAGLVAR